MLRRTIIAVLSLFAATAVLAEAYKWVDENGVVHYSDKPHDGWERVELPTDGQRPPPRPAATPRSLGGPVEEAQPSQPFSYESLAIGSPSAEETLWNIEGVLNVSLNLQPRLQPGHRVRVYFDGEPRFVTGTSFQIEEVYRGVHNIQAEILDEAGNLMIRSLPNRFYVQQNTIVRAN